MTEALKELHDCKDDWPLNQNTPKNKYIFRLGLKYPDFKESCPINSLFISFNYKDDSFS